ncbi:hypothetical protein X801_08226 [Opisthorchis viverrini]|uniref:Uncharacterized protein n=1 Tax=Opisthorchis viverrini TaxID=6198 RepID=A0A1S8WNG6_OPIVI|nr:hypothetical protein X801_08226 [Opisthorchis viverrini]
MGQSEEPLLLLPSHGVESNDALGKVDEYIVNRQSRINKVRKRSSGMLPMDEITNLGLDNITCSYRDSISQISHPFAIIIQTMEFLQSQPLDRWFNESDVMQYVYPEVPESLKLDAMLNLRHSLFWIASGRGQNDQPFSLCAVASVGHTRREVTAECYSTLLASAERRILVSQSPPVASDWYDVLCAKWDWKRSST